MGKRQTPPEDEAPASDDAPGATAFVRLDDAARLPPPRAAPTAPTAGAPKKGLQVTLPDDEPPPPKPKPKAAPPPQGPKGRRGAWWDEQSAASPDEAAEAPAEEEPPPEPPSDDAPGATAFLKVEEPPPPARKPPPSRRPQPAAAPPPDDGSTQFYKPEEVILQADVRERPAPTAPAPAGMPWKLILGVLLGLFLFTVLSVVVVYRREIFGSSRPAAKAATKGNQPADE